MHILGNWETREIRIDGRKLNPDYSQSIYNHSPDGFNWGYGGSAPAQLALALLLTTTDPETAIRLHQDFKWAFIATLPQTDFEKEIDIENYVKDKSGKINRNGLQKSINSPKVKTLFGEAICTRGHEEKCQYANETHCDCTCGGINHGKKTQSYFRKLRVSDIKNIAEKGIKTGLYGFRLIRSKK